MVGRRMPAKTTSECPMPEYALAGGAGFDLRIAETVPLRPFERGIVGCGLAVAIPSGCVVLLFMRSGISAKPGVTRCNSVGVIDSSYRGESGAALVNNSPEAVPLEAGERICQLVVMPYVPCELVPVEDLNETERGAGGFGSTGTE